MIIPDLKKLIESETPAFLRYRYEGLSTATKPATLPDGSALPAGAQFQELDTRPDQTSPLLFSWDGTNWNEIDRRSTDASRQLAVLLRIEKSLEVLAPLAETLEMLRLGMIEAGACKDIV